MLAGWSFASTFAVVAGSASVLVKTIVALRAEAAAVAARASGKFRPVATYAGVPVGKVAAIFAAVA
jgi:hypothetical protein